MYTLLHHAKHNKVHTFQIQQVTKSLPLGCTVHACLVYSFNTYSYYEKKNNLSMDTN